MTNQETTWMTIREAALALAVSELTVRRRIKDGRLQHRLVNGKYFVDLQSAPGMLGSGEDSDNQVDEATDHQVQGPPRLITRVNQGVISSELRATDPEATNADSDGRQDVNRHSVSGIDLDALLSEHARLAEVAGRAGLLQEQYAELTARYEELEAGMLSLAGRNGWLESKLEERESQIKLLTDQAPRRSWWGRLFRS